MQIAIVWSSVDPSNIFRWNMEKIYGKYSSLKHYIMYTNDQRRLKIFSRANPSLQNISKSFLKIFVQLFDP